MDSKPYPPPRDFRDPLEEEHDEVLAAEPEEDKLTLAQKLLARMGISLGRKQPKGVHTQGPSGSVRDQRRLSGRRVRAITHDRAHTPHARLGRAKPTKSRFQQESEQRAAIKASLSNIKVIQMLPEVPDIKYIMAAMPKVKTVWQLSRLTTEQVHAIPGLGPVRRKKIHAYLTDHHVRVSWSA